MSTYQYILLDWDGNLARTLDIWLEACRVALEEQGVFKSDEEIGASFGQFTKYMKDWGVKDIQATIECADRVAQRQLPDVELYPDALEVLEALRDQNKKLALITTSPRENVQPLLERHGLTRTFDAVITAEDTINHKPHPEPLELALKLLGGNTNEAVMIGDSDKDLGAAKNAGVDSVLFYPSEHQKFYNLDTLRQLEPTFVIEDFREILNIV